AGRLRQALLAAADSYFAVIDEGPGLSGSTFAAVVSGLRQLGVPSDRVVLFPSRDVDADRLLSSDAQSVWRTTRRFVAATRAPAQLSPLLRFAGLGAYGIAAYDRARELA